MVRKKLSNPLNFLLSICLVNTHQDNSIGWQFVQENQFAEITIFSQDNPFIIKSARLRTFLSVVLGASSATY